MPDEPKFKKGDKVRLAPAVRDTYPPELREAVLTVENVCNRYGKINDPDPNTHPAYNEKDGTIYEPAEDTLCPFALLERELEAA